MGRWKFLQVSLISIFSFNWIARDLKSLTNLKLGHNLIKSFQGYFFLRNVQYLDLSHNVLTNVGNETMIGDNMQNLKQFRLNENQLVLCDAFFYQMSRLPNLQALDLKQANMPCICDLPVRPLKNNQISKIF